MPFVVSAAARAGGAFTYERDGDTLTIHHRAILPSADLQMAANRAYATARRIREGLDGVAALGFGLPDGFGVGWSYDDWQSFGHTLVQAELLAIVATGWDGVVDEAGQPFPKTDDAIRALLLRDSALYQAWCEYAARLTIEAAEGNASAPSPIGSSAGAGATARAAAH